MNFRIVFTIIFCFNHALNASSILSSMTIEEKVGQLLMVHFNGEEVNEEIATLIQKANIGAIIYYNWANGLHSPKQVKQLSDGLQELAQQTKLKIPLIVAIDQEGGRVTRLNKGFTPLPSCAAIAEAGKPSNARKHAMITAEELRVVGINMILAPVVDVNVNPKNPVIGDRSYGSTPQIVVSYAREALKGFHKGGLMTVLKHFPGHGDVTEDSHTHLPVLNKSYDELTKIELKPFTELHSNADAIMTAHLMVPALDPFNCTTLSKKTLDALLRKEYGFKGVIISDSLVMKAVLTHCDNIPEVAVRALEAGCDLLILGGKQLIGNDNMELSCKEILAIYHYIVEAVSSGRISEKRLNSSVERVLHLKEKYLVSYPSVSVIDKIKVPKNEAKEIGLKIWKNECASSVDGLCTWNIGEDFASMGIGHFIWYHRNTQAPYEEQFPKFLSFLESQGVELPEWLRDSKCCPWESREAFYNDKEGSKIKALKSLLVATVDLQVLFITERVENALPKILTSIPKNKKDRIQSQFYRVANSPNGLYALLDYINFKGEGSSTSERYNGKGWGLLQVLELMPEKSTKGVIQDFVTAAKTVLSQRVKNAPPEKNEGRWLQGWLNRVDTYTKGNT